MSSIISRLLGRNRNSASQAKDRLHMVLIHDRTDLTPSTLDKMKDEIIEVISRHIDIDSRAVRIEMNKEGRQQRLIAEIPIRGPRRRRL